MEIDGAKICTSGKPFLAEIVLEHKGPRTALCEVLAFLTGYVLSSSAFARRSLGVRSAFASLKVARRVAKHLAQASNEALGLSPKVSLRPTRKALHEISSLCMVCIKPIACSIWRHVFSALNNLKNSETNERSNFSEVELLCSAVAFAA